MGTLLSTQNQKQSKQRVFPGERVPKKAKTVPSTGKVMATIIWDSHGIIFIDYLEKGKTELFDKFHKELMTKRVYLSKKKIIFHHDNAPVHTPAIAVAKLVELRYEILPHPAYSPNLAYCDFFLFGNMKKWPSGKKFDSDEEIITETNSYFAGFKKGYFLDGIKKLEKRWTKYIELKGDYIEK